MRVDSELRLKLKMLLLRKKLELQMTFQYAGFRFGSCSCNALLEDERSSPRPSLLIVIVMFGILVLLFYSKTPARNSNTEKYAPIERKIGMSEPFNLNLSLT